VQYINVKIYQKNDWRPEMLKRPTNCWEHMQCGREPGGVKAAELGICPAAVDDAFDGINTGLAVAFENDPLETGCQLSGPFIFKMCNILTSKFIKKMIGGRKC
jgi:hypothetical protein